MSELLNRLRRWLIRKLGGFDIQKIEQTRIVSPVVNIDPIQLRVEFRVGAEPITTAFGLPIDRLRKLAQADREGRCMVLPKDGMVYYIEEAGGEKWIGNKPIQQECGVFAGNAENPGGLNLRGIFIAAPSGRAPGPPPGQAVSWP